MKNEMKYLVIVVWFFIVIGVAVNNVDGELPLNDSNLSGGGNDTVEDIRVEAEKKADEEYEKSGRGSYKPEYIAVYGKLPEFETEEEKMDWFHNQEAVAKGLRNKTSPFFYPSGPIISTGRRADGYFVVAIYKNFAVDKSLLDEIYGLFDEEAKKRGIREVPVRFMLEDLIQLDEEVADTNEDIPAPDETGNAVPSSDNTTSKSVPGLGLLGGFVSLF